MPKKVLYAEKETLPGACGVGIIYEFSIDDEEDPDWSWNDSIDPSIVGGAGWTGAGFIDKQYCKEVWAWMTKRYKVAYKTPIRVNKNTGNKFFFALFDGKSPRPENARSLKWPFKDTK